MSIESPFGGDPNLPGGGSTPGGLPGPPSGPSPPPSTPGTATERVSGGAAAEQGLIPPITAPRGAATIIPTGRDTFDYILEAFEGLNVGQTPLSIGELQATKMENLITEKGALEKRKGSDDVTSSGTTGEALGIHQASALRSLLLDALDSIASWVASDAVNFTPTLETTIKQEGTGAMKIVAQGAGADGDTIKRDLGAGATIDLSKYDYIEFLNRGIRSTDGIKFGISEDDITYTEADFVESPTGQDSWAITRLTISSLAASARNAIRYFRFRYTNNSGLTRTFYVDHIRAYRRTTHLLWAKRISGASAQGGGRDSPSTLEFEIHSNLSGAWAGLVAYPPTPANTKVRFLDFLGTTYYAAGPAGMGKVTNGIYAPWTAPPPADFLESHLDKMWLFGVRHDLHQLRHANVSKDDEWPVDADPDGSNGGVFYVGRNYPYLPTGLKAAFSQIFAWTEADLWVLAGSDADTWNLSRAYPGAGLLSMESLAEFDQGLAWHDGRNNRILLWSGSVVDLSDPIKTELEAIPENMKPWTSMFFTGRHLLFSYAASGATSNNRALLCDPILRRWHGPYTGEWVGFNASVVGTDGKFYVGRSAGGVRQILTTTDDAGAAIAMGYKLPLFKRIPRAVHEIRRLWIRFRNTNTSVTAKLYRNFGTVPVWTRTYVPTGQVSEMISKRCNVRGEVLELELTESSTTALTIDEIGASMARIRLAA